MIYLAGPFAQRRFAPRSNWRSGNDDFDIVKKERARGRRGPVPQSELASMESLARQLVDQLWTDIRAVAKALLKHGTLTGRQIRGAIDELRSKHPQKASRPNLLAHYRALAQRENVDLMKHYWLDGYTIKEAAYHEAAHGVLALACQLRVESATIKPRGALRGRVIHDG